MMNAIQRDDRMIARFSALPATETGWFSRAVPA
jgi:hypothetical protein